MTASTAFLGLVTDAMRGLGPVTVKRMFGGAGIYAGGVMIGLVADDVLYLKADDTTKTSFEAEGLGPFVYDGKSKPISMSYWRVPERLYDDPDEMAEWARRALAVALRAGAGRKPRPSRPAPGKPTRSRPRAKPGTPR